MAHRLGRHAAWRAWRAAAPAFSSAASSDPALVGAAASGATLGPLLAAFAGGCGAGVAVTFAAFQGDPKPGRPSAKAGLSPAPQAASQEASCAIPVWFGFRRVPAVDGEGAGGFASLYALGPELGRGSYGITYAATPQTATASTSAPAGPAVGEEVAVKVLAKRALTCADAIEDVDREVEIMRHLSGHENVVRFFDALEDEHHVYIVMEKCAGGELFDAVVDSATGGRYTERRAAETIRQVRPPPYRSLPPSSPTRPCVINCSSNTRRAPPSFALALRACGWSLPYPSPLLPSLRLLVVCVCVFPFFF